MGQKYAAYDSTGGIYAYYDSEDSPAPAGVAVLEISEDEWLTCINNPGYTVVGGELVAPAAPTDDELVESAQAVQSAVLYAACQSAITGGFTSDALGVAHTYPSTDTDQQNLASAVGAASYHSASDGWTTQLWCEASGETWSFADHTATQVQEVNSSFVSFRTGLQALLYSGVQAVDAATTVSGVEAITWASLAAASGN